MATGQYIYKKKVKNKQDGFNSSVHWSDKKKYEVAAVYAKTGNQDLTSKITGVPEPTLVTWRKKDWFKTMLAEIRLQEEVKLDSKMTKVIDTAMEAIEDRLINGDYILDSKTGAVVRIPPKMKDTAQVLDKVYNKRQLIRKEPTNITENVTKIEDQLKKLADQFEIMVRGRTPQELEIEDAIIIAEDYIEDEDNDSNHSN